MSSSKTVSFTNVFSTPGIYSNFSVRLTKDEVSDETNCYSSYSYRRLNSTPVGISWSDDTIEPGFGDLPTNATLVWDFIAGDTIKVFAQSNCGGVSVSTHTLSSPGSSYTINLQPNLNSGTNTTFF